MKANRGVTLALLLTLGCAANRGGLGVEAKAVTTQKPGMVSAYLSVTEDDDAAVGLMARDFTVYEDGLALSHESTQLVLLDKAQAAEHHTLVLLDDSEATSAEVKRELLEAINVFVPLVQPTQSVSVYAFDGSERLRAVAEFARKPASIEAPQREFRSTVQAPVPETPVLKSTAALGPRDTSRNLNGALLLAEKELARRLARSGKALSTGTLVVFAGGPDLAGRVPAREVEAMLRETPHFVFGISFAGPQNQLLRYAKDGYFEGFSHQVLTLAFEEVGHRVVSFYEREYLLSYCSPARRGERSLRIEARVLTDDGREKKGAASSSFQADGFGGSCDPHSAPRFAKSLPTSQLR